MIIFNFKNLDEADCRCNGSMCEAIAKNKQGKVVMCETAQQCEAFCPDEEEKCICEDGLCQVVSSLQKRLFLSVDAFIGS